MRAPFAALLALALLAAGLPASAGSISPELQQRLDSAAPADFVPVIVELVAQGHPAQAAAGAARNDRHGRGRAVVQELQDTANRTQGQVRALIAREEAAGNARNVKSFWVINGFALSAHPDAIARIAAHGDVNRVRFDRKIPAPHLTPSSISTTPPSTTDPVWNIAQIRAPDVWNLGYDGTGVVVGSFDTGVDGTHPDLAPRYRGNDAISWYDPYGEHDTPYDNNGHGTHTTGTAVGGDASGNSIGVAPGARWIAAKSFDDSDNATTSAFHQVFQWFLAPGGDAANAPDVVNNSWGLSPPDCYPDFMPDVQAMRAAGIFMAFAAGNEGPAPSSMLSPGNYNDGFSVGATDPDDFIADFSSRGPSQCTGEIKPDISAPGVSVLSALPGEFWFELDGTSMATPHVTGAAAVLKSINPALSVDDLESYLSQGAVDLGTPGADNDFGVGRLDLFQSARLLLGLPLVSITATTPKAFEAGTVPGVFTLKRDGDLSAALTVTYTVGGTATPGADYVALPGSATIPAGATTATIVVNPIDDTEVELDETVIVHLNTPAGYIVGPAQATVTIVSDEIPPDFVVSAFGAPTSAAAGGTISVTDTTRNQGAAPGLASLTYFYLSPTATIDASSVLLGSRSVPALAAGASSTGTTTLTIPSTIAGATYYLVAKADGNDALVETQENNNSFPRAIAIGPDLLVSALTVPASSGAGATITVTDTTTNSGAGAAGASTTSFYISPSFVFDASAVLIGSRAVPALAAGSSSTASTALTLPATLSTATYYVYAQADSANAVSEANETNNVMQRSLPIGADLVLLSVTAPASAGAGMSITITDTTQNQGGGAAPASNTRFYLSTNLNLDASDLVLGARAVPALAAGATSTGSVSVTIPTTVAPGAYWLLAKADGDDAITETRESNNTYGLALSIGPDLVVSALSAPTDSGAGLVITVTDTTKNQGSGIAPASTTAFYLSTDATLDASDVALGSRAVPSLAAGATSAVSTALTIPAGTAPGSYFLVAVADSGGTVAEATETNNVFTRSLRIGPDLVMNSLSAPTVAGAGATITVTDTVKNQGGGNAAASTTRYYLSANATLDAGDVMIGARPVAALAAGASDTGSAALTIPASTAGGTYFLIAAADADGAIAETIETNNTIAASIAIGADLTITSFTAPTDSGAGLPLTVSDTTKNQGSGTTPATTTSYYLSADASVDSSDVLLGSRTVAALAAGASDTGSATLTIPAGTASGSYYIIAKADAGGVVSETSESNNAFARPLRVGPDLLVASVGAPASTGAGATITVTDTTRNQGGGNAPATTTRYFLSTNTTLDAGDIALGARAVAALGPGASDTGSVALAIPASTANGIYYLIAAADNDNVVAEAQEANNTASVSLLIGGDLSVTSLASPSTGGAGLAINVTDTTKNLGAGAVPASVTGFYLSANTVLDAGDTFLGSRSVAALAAGASDTATTALVIPAGTAAGTYYLFAQADSTNAIVEASESNNTALRSIVIGPDLYVASLSVPPTASAGGTITITDTTRNLGGGNAPASSTKYYLSVNAGLDASDTFLGARAVAALGPGAQDTGSVAVTLPGSANGSYYVIAVADGDSAVGETSESNNQLIASITIGTDMVVSSFSAPAVAGAGATITVTDTTKNQGSGIAAASTTMYWLSTNAALDASDTLLGTRAVAPLGSGATDTASVTLTIPPGTATGTYYIFAQADGGNVVSETSESNNTAFQALRVGPDLTVSSVSAPSSAHQGTTVTFTDTTRNQGGGMAPATNTRYYLSLNTTIDGSDIFLGSRAVAALAGGGADTGTVTLTIPPGTPSALYYLLVKADGDDAVAETLENNNLFAGVLQITP